jgi:hypothetical protein
VTPSGRSAAIRELAVFAPDPIIDVLYDVGAGWVAMMPIVPASVVLESQDRSKKASLPFGVGLGTRPAPGVLEGFHGPTPDAGR